MAKSATVVLLLALIGLPVAYLSAESQDDPAVKRDKPVAKIADPAKVAVPAKAADPVKDVDPANDAGANDAPVAKRSDAPDLIEEDPLGRTLRLTFTIKNDDGDHAFPVLCAGRSFLIEHDMSEDDGSNRMRFRGLLKGVDQKDRVFVQFDLIHSHSNIDNGFDATLTLKGSAMPTFGKKIALGNLGDEQVSLTVSLVK
ncbi:MAG: hypothetical protein ACE5KM_20490 [Planctomycetaceae bacterium]